MIVSVTAPHGETPEDHGFPVCRFSLTRRHSATQNTPELALHPSPYFSHEQSFNANNSPQIKCSLCLTVAPNKAGLNDVILLGI